MRGELAQELELALREDEVVPARRGLDPLRERVEAGSRLRAARLPQRRRRPRRRAVPRRPPPRRGSRPAPSSNCAASASTWPLSAAARVAERGAPELAALGGRRPARLDAHDRALPRAQRPRARRRAPRPRIAVGERGDRTQLVGARRGRRTRRGARRPRARPRAPRAAPAPRARTAEDGHVRARERPDARRRARRRPRRRSPARAAAVPLARAGRPGAGTAAIAAARRSAARPVRGRQLRRLADAARRRPREPLVRVRDARRGSGGRARRAAAALAASVSPAPTSTSRQRRSGPAGASALQCASGSAASARPNVGARVTGNVASSSGPPQSRSRSRSNGERPKPDDERLERRRAPASPPRPRVQLRARPRPRRRPRPPRARPRAPPSRWRWFAVCQSRRAHVTVTRWPGSKTGGETLRSTSRLSTPSTRRRSQCSPGARTDDLERERPRWRAPSGSARTSRLPRRSEAACSGRTSGRHVTVSVTSPSASRAAGAGATVSSSGATARATRVRLAARPASSSEIAYRPAGRTSTGVRQAHLDARRARLPAGAARAAAPRADGPRCRAVTVVLEVAPAERHDLAEHAPPRGRPAAPPRVERRVRRHGLRHDRGPTSPSPRVSTGSGARAGRSLSISTTVASYAADMRYSVWNELQSFDISSSVSGSGVMRIALDLVADDRRPRAPPRSRRAPSTGWSCRTLIARPSRRCDEHLVEPLPVHGQRGSGGRARAAAGRSRPGRAVGGSRLLQPAFGVTA